MAQKVFTDGSALSASELNTYLMEQVIIRCTSGTRPSSPAEGMTIYETDTNRFLTYNGGWVRIELFTTSTGRTGCKLVRNANQTIPHNTSTNISWDTESYDTDSFIGVTSDTVTIPTGLTGLYLMTAQVQWVSDPRTAGNTFIEITCGGKAFRNASTSSYAQFNSVTAVYPLAATDTIQVNVLQMSSGSASLAFTQANLVVARLSP